MRPNTRQRSWSDYEGDNPIKRYKGSSFYRDSALHGPTKGGEEPPEDEGTDPLKQKERSRLRDSMLKLGTPVTGAYDPSKLMA